jgi:TorA maturation chaperone TorD
VDSAIDPTTTSDLVAPIAPASPAGQESPKPGLRQAWERLSEAADRRALAWRRLSEAFYTPDVAWVAALLNGSIEADLRRAVSWLDSNQELYAPSLDALRRWVERSQELDAARVLEEVSVDHARLFVGPENPPASPYESVWTDVDPMSGKPIFNGPSTVAVEAVYRELGLVQMPDHHDLPDHVATETEFLCYLCEQEAAAWRADDADRAKELRSIEEQFIKTHLGRFAREFCQAIDAAGHESCYAVFAGFLLAHLTVESGTPYLEVVGSIWSSPGHNG